MIPSTSPSPVRLSAADMALEQATFMQKVYGYMCAGLGFTALAAWLVANSPTALQIVFGNRLVFFGLIIAELLMVVAFSRLARTMTASGAASLFFLYSIVNGVTLS